MQSKSTELSKKPMGQRHFEFYYLCCYFSKEVPTQVSQDSESLQVLHLILLHFIQGKVN